MGRFTSAKHYVAASILIPAGAALVWPSNSWITILMILWLVLAAMFWIRAERKNNQERMTRTIQAMQSSSIRTLNHHRHDWMNDLQVLYGYARLGKLDKTILYVEKIKTRMAVETAIAKLGVPSLISFIQSFRTITNSLALEVEIQDELNIGEMSIDAEGIAETLIHIINAYRFAVKAGNGELSVLRLELSADEDALYAAFYYEGELMNEQQWNKKIKQQLEGAPLKQVGSEQSFSKVLLRAEMSA
ncbi:Spo0B domain-containing protein [Paenibacillus sp. GSMTC-2017]|uniref:Spo0B domain-containing protein n=1 Tax=Paenibacillus sp. GSMTC-2017 TaxID=2794350 RepID=UPI0018D86CCA|nr:Spo0B domain-containing protein [Paenibacillus sp. GSMTC-2017]MBH5317145.1 Spo0B domain-containing protein [Paenibacillus sp. GSMTC-2017]